MKKTFALLSICLGLALVGCKKKEKEADTTAATGTAAGTATTPPPPDPNAGTGDMAGTGAGTGDMAGTGAGTGEGTGDMAGTGAGTGDTAAAGDVPEAKKLPDGMPADCQKAFDAMSKLRTCAKHDAKMRKQMIDAWNSAVDGSFVHYGKASADQKKTIEGSCTSMTKSVDMLVKDC